jgi:hypothetical protein
MMANKTKERARLLKLYRKTGDEDYKRAAEALKLPLLDHIKQLDLYPGRVRGPTVLAEAFPRFYRMHRSIAAGKTVSAAARKEVNEHGRGAHTSEDTAFNYLRHHYPEHAERIAADMALAQQLSEPYQQMARSAEQLNRMTRAYMPPDWILNLERHQPWGSFVRSVEKVASMVMHPIASWRNTLPKNGQEKIQ